MTWLRITLRRPSRPPNHRFGDDDFTPGDIDLVNETHGTVQFVDGVAYVDDVVDAGLVAALLAHPRGSDLRWGGRFVEIEAADPPPGWPPPASSVKIGTPLGFREPPTRNSADGRPERLRGA